MKKILTLIALFAFAISSYAQVSETSRSMSQGKNNALTISLKKSDKKSIEKRLEKFLKKNYDGKTKRNKKSGEIFSDNSKIEKMSSNAVDIYAVVDDAGDDTQLTVWFDLGGAFLSSSIHADRYPAGKKILTDFALTIEKSNVEDNLKSQKKSLGKLEGNLKDLEKDEKKLHKNIKEWEEKIAKAKKEIEEKKSAQKNKTKEIETQKRVVKEVETKLKKL